MTLQLATPQTRPWRLDLGRWLRVTTRSALDGAASLTDRLARPRPAIPAPASVVQPRFAVVPRRPAGALGHISSLASILDSQIERGEHVARTHERASQMLGSIEYELQCLTADLSAVSHRLRSRSAPC